MIYKVYTPVGEFNAEWSDDDGDLPVSYTGNEDAINYFKMFLDIAFIAKEDGHPVNFERLQPNDMYNYCQSVEYGVSVMPDFVEVLTSAIQDSEGNEMNITALDSTENDFALLGEAAQLLKGLNEDSPTFFEDFARISEILGSMGGDDSGSDAEVQAIINSQTFKRLKNSAISSLGVIFAIDSGEEKGYDRALFVSSILNKFKVMAKNESELFANVALAWLSVFNERNGKPALTKRHSIWNLGTGFEPYKKYFQKSGQVEQPAKPLITPYQMGVDAFNTGRDRAPALNKEFMNEFIAKNDGKSAEYMDEYLRGWDETNLAAPIPEDNSESIDNLGRGIVKDIVDGLIKSGLVVVPEYSDSLSEKDITYQNISLVRNFNEGEGAYYNLGSRWGVFYESNSGGSVHSGSIYVSVRKDNVTFGTPAQYNGLNWIQSLPLIEVGKKSASAVVSEVLTVIDNLIKKSENQNQSTEKKTEINNIFNGYSALRAISPFLSGDQRKIIKENMIGEEGQYFIDKVIEIQGVIESMPVLRGQENSDDPIAYLHYFMGSIDSYITEKDDRGEGTESAFGFQDLGYGGELGYISITELVSNGMELDLSWTPKPLSKLGVIEPSEPEQEAELAPTMENIGKELQKANPAWVMGAFSNNITVGGGRATASNPEGKRRLFLEQDGLTLTLNYGGNTIFSIADYSQLDAERIANRVNNFVMEYEKGESMPENVEPVQETAPSVALSEAQLAIEAEKAFLESVIAGKENLMDSDIADKLIALAEKYESGDPSMVALASNAIEVYSIFAMSL